MTEECVHTCSFLFCRLLNRCFGRVVSRPPGDARQHLTPGASRSGEPRSLHFLCLHAQENLQRVQVRPAALCKQYSSCLSGNVQAVAFILSASSVPANSRCQSFDSPHFTFEVVIFGAFYTNGTINVPCFFHPQGGAHKADPQGQCVFNHSLCLLF